VGTPQDWWPQITQGDIARTQNNPLNTYHHPGLPPQPIASPTLASIEAAVNPPSTPYFAFAHTNGSHGMSRFCTAQQFKIAQATGQSCNTTPQ